nr:DUF6233 domain-containing protein [Streptomyces atratus]
MYPNEMGFISREDAVIALGDPDIEACQICSPETGLLQVNRPGSGGGSIS